MSVCPVVGVKIPIIDKKIELKWNAATLFSSEVAFTDEGIKYVGEFLGKEICLRTEYVDKSDSEVPNWSWCYMNGVFLEGEGVCQAYAYAYQYLCHRAGLWSVTVSGNCHCWNMVQLENGATYHVDLTWADSAENFENSCFGVHVRF